MTYRGFELDEFGRLFITTKAAHKVFSQKYVYFPKIWKGKTCIGRWNNEPNDVRKMIDELYAQ